MVLLQSAQLFAMLLYYIFYDLLCINKLIRLVQFHTWYMLNYYSLHTWRIMICLMCISKIIRLWHTPYYINGLRWKNFVVVEINYNLLENIHGCVVVLCGQTLLHRDVITFSPEKFCSYQSACENLKSVSTSNDLQYTIHASKTNLSFHIIIIGTYVDVFCIFHCDLRIPFNRL